jgi:hypothetical protein
MRVTIYDKLPGHSFMQRCLGFSWFLGCWFQKLIGKVDKYYGASSWADAIDWLKAQQPALLTNIQYWGHGRPGKVMLAGRYLDIGTMVALKPCVAPNTIIWFRTCSTFQGVPGHEFSSTLSNLLGCVVAGHTRVIGLFQGGLHTRRAGAPASWPTTEGEFKENILSNNGLIWGNNTIFCLTTDVPKGW